MTFLWYAAIIYLIYIIIVSQIYFNCLKKYKKWLYDAVYKGIINCHCATRQFEWAYISPWWAYLSFCIFGGLPVLSKIHDIHSEMHEKEEEPSLFEGLFLEAEAKRKWYRKAQNEIDEYMENNKEKEVKE